MDTKQTHIIPKKKLKVLRKLKTALYVRLFIMAAELIGGIIADSLAVISDSTEKFTDALAILVAIISVYLSTKPPYGKYSFGYHRAGVIGALLSVAMMWIIAGILVYCAILRVMDLNSFTLDGYMMLYTAAGSMTIDMITMVILKCSSKKPEKKEGEKKKKKKAVEPKSDDSETHKLDINKPLINEKKDDSSDSSSDSDSSDSSLEYKPQAPSSSDGDNENLRAVVLDIIGDIFQAIVIIIASIFIISDQEKYKILDPIATFIFPIIVLFATKSIIRDCVRMLMESGPDHLLVEKIRIAMRELPGCEDVHALRVWNLNYESMCVSCHLRVKDGHKGDLLQDALKKLKKYSVYEAFVQIESGNMKCKKFLKSKYD